LSAHDKLRDKDGALILRKWVSSRSRRTIAASPGGVVTGGMRGPAPG